MLETNEQEFTKSTQKEGALSRWQGPGGGTNTRRDLAATGIMGWRQRRSQGGEASGGGWGSSCAPAVSYRPSLHPLISHARPFPKCLLRSLIQRGGDGRRPTGFGNWERGRQLGFGNGRLEGRRLRGNRWGHWLLSVFFFFFSSPSFPLSTLALTLGFVLFQKRLFCADFLKGSFLTKEIIICFCLGHV